MNNGSLPFSGRAAELKKIVKFWDLIPDFHSLRSLLISGEAGIGKSRLFDEVIKSIELDENGIIIRVKLHIGSGASLLPLISKALSGNPAVRSLLRKDIEPSISAISSALTRLASLRKTMLITEDIHLLSSETIMEFAELIFSLNDEPMGLLCSARPTNSKAISVLEPTLIESIQLKGFDNKAIQNLWYSLFSDNHNHELIEKLQKETNGNPLAVRSALRTAIITEVQDEDTNEATITFDEGKFRNSISRNIKSLSEGMTAHLTESELQYATRLAGLGEIFSIEAAEKIIDDAEDSVRELMFKGILSHSNTVASPIFGNPSKQRLLAFSHSLTHKYFLDKVKINSDEWLSVISSSAGIYAITPVELLINQIKSINHSPAEIANIVQFITLAGISLTISPNWALSLPIIELLNKIKSSHKQNWSAEEIKKLNSLILSRLISLLSRDGHTKKRMELSQELVIESEGFKDEPYISYRFEGISSLIFHKLRLGTVGEEKEAEELLAEFLREFPLEKYAGLGTSYTMYLTALLHYYYFKAHYDKIIPMLEEVEKIPNICTRRPENSYIAAKSFFLCTYGNAYELNKNIQTATELAKQERISEIGISPVPSYVRSFFFVDALSFPNAENETLASVKKTREVGFEQVSALLLSLYETVLTIQGKSIDECQISIRHHLSQTKKIGQQDQIEICYHRTIIPALLCGDDSYIMSLDKEVVKSLYEINITPYSLSDWDLAYYLLLVKDTEAIANFDSVCKHSSTLLWELLHSAVLGELEKFIKIGSDIIHAEAMSVKFIIRYYTIISLYDLFIKQNNKTKADDISNFTETIENIIDKIIAFFIEKNIPVCITPIINHFSGYVKNYDLKKILRQIAATKKEYLKNIPKEKKNTHKVSLYLLGKIEFSIDDAGREFIRGGRMKSLLGLMTANSIAKKPLERVEFETIAAGEEGGKDPELNRKTVGMAVLALRKLIGNETIIQDENGVYQFNKDLVSIDLVRAYKNIRSARKALSSGHLVKAREAMLSAAKLACQKVPYPTLYDGYFESAREDFETYLRNAIYDVAHALVNEEDYSAAEQLLRLGLDWLPDDEEISLLLEKCSIAIGESAAANAIRVRRKIEID